jgi:hypothetical protein
MTHGGKIPTGGATAELHRSHCLTMRDSPAVAAIAQRIDRAVRSPVRTALSAHQSALGGMPAWGDILPARGAGGISGSVLERDWAGSTGRARRVGDEQRLACLFRMGGFLIGNRLRHGGVNS